MHQVWPDHHREGDDLVAELSTRERWTALNFVAALDGAIAIDGRSGPLGGAGDLQLFRALRDRCDVVLVGAGTARAENYGPPSDRDAAARMRRGQAARPALAMVTRSGHLSELERVWADDDVTVVVLTGTGMTARTRSELEERGAQVVVAGDGESVDASRAVAALHDRGFGRILCEGGPALAHDMLAAGVVTDMFTTIAGLVVGGTPTMVPRALPVPVELELAAVRVSHDELLVHHRVTGGRSVAPDDRD